MARCQHPAKVDRRVEGKPGHHDGHGLGNLVDRKKGAGEKKEGSDESTDEKIKLVHAFNQAVGEKSQAPNGNSGKKTDQGNQNRPGGEDEAPKPKNHKWNG